MGLPEATDVTDFAGFLSSVDGSDEPVSEAWLFDQLSVIAENRRKAGMEIPQEIEWERVAFALWVSRAEERPWGTHYGPASVLRSDNGGVIESPPREMITREAVSYWKARAETTRHPVLKGRYADLVWDFAGFKEDFGDEIKRARPQMAGLVIEAAIELSSTRIHPHLLEIVRCLQRALELAELMKDDILRTQAISALLRLHEVLKPKEGLAYRLFAFKTLILDRTACLTEEDTSRLVMELRDLLAGLCSPPEGQVGDPHAAADVARMLREYYRSTGQGTEAQLVLQMVGRNFERAARQVAGILAPEFYKQAHLLFQEAGLKEEASRAMERIRVSGQGALKEMKVVSSTVEIDRGEVDRFVEELTSGSLDGALQKIASRFLPRREEVIKRMGEIAEVAPLQAIIPRQLLGTDGLLRAVVGTISDDPEGRSVLQCVQEISIQSIFLGRAIEKLKERHDGRRGWLRLLTWLHFKPAFPGLDAEKTLGFLSKSPLFDEMSRPILKIGLEAYFGGDILSALHILPARIESATRRLAELSGASTVKSNTLGGYDWLSLDGLLRGQGLLRVFGDEVGEDVRFYFRTLLTDRRGLSLRNDVYHGLKAFEQFNQVMADRALHALLLLGLVRVQNLPEGS